MSHFTVLVPAKDKKELEQRLLPFHEYECTGYKEYTVLVDETDEILADFEKYGKDSPQTFREWVKGWTSAKEDPETGRYFRRTNPNKKWDWWIVGGRWSGLLQLKSNDVLIERGKPGTFGRMNYDDRRGDAALVSEIDWDGMRREQFDQAMQRWHDFQAARKKAHSEDIPDDIMERAQKHKAKRGLDTPMLKLARKMYQDYILMDEYNVFVLWGDEWDNLSLDQKEYEQKFKHSALTYAFIDLEGNWNQRGEMGWWGLDDKTQGTPDYDEVFWRFIESLPGDQKVYVVDCHI